MPDQARSPRFQYTARGIRRLLRVAALCAIAAGLPLATVARAETGATQAPAMIRTFLSSHCYDCHQGSQAEAGLDLAALPFDLEDDAVKKRWVRIFDRVHQGEMPPPDVAELDSTEAARFLRTTGDWLRAFQRAEDEQFGRVRGRRLTRRELERSLQDLLGIDIPLTEHLPADPDSTEFTTVADAQTISHFHLERHLAAVDAALEEALRRALGPEDRYQHHFDFREVARRPERERTREPEIIGEQAVVWSSGLIFYGRIPATAAPENGWYRFKVRVSGLKLPESGGVWSTVRSGLCVSSAPLLAWIEAFEAVDEPKEIEFKAWLPKRHMLEIRPGDTTLKKARFAGGQVGNGEGDPQNVPGIAIDWITMERFHRGPDNEGVRRLLFGDLEVRKDSGSGEFQVVSEAPEKDLARLLEAFARRAFRRPVSRDEISEYLDLGRAALQDGQELTEALRIGYRAILCSPRFLYFSETPGRLDDHAIATRLSYVLTGSTPDQRLTELADAGRLHDPTVIREEAERLLSGDGARRFVEDFAAEWLDLDQIDFTEPDRKLYPDFDAIVQHAMLDETHTYLETMLRENLGVAHLIDSDFTFLSSRLARFYEIEGVEGDALRRVSLEPEHRRGGVITQGAVLKVTANGTTTSPVIRGVWVSERLLGEPIPPPPGDIPAIEPDIRGATTIRELLAKHRSQDMCASCHVKIDPPGFALENYDPAGQWRERYGSRRDRGPTVDASYVLPDGREFQDIGQFQSLIAAEPERLARNVAEKLMVFGTGGPVSFADREAIDQIVDESARAGYGFRSILHAVLTSPVFLSK